MQGLSLGRLLGVPVFVSWTAFLILAIIVFQRDIGSPAATAAAILYGLGVIASILVHELGHAVVGRRLGLAPQGIVIHGFGGLCSYGRAPRGREGVLSAGAGPAAGLTLGLLLVGVIFAAGGALPPVMEHLLKEMAWFNLFWSVFNLLPMWPLDGGHMLWHGLRTRTHPGKAWQITRSVGITLAILVALVGWYLNWTFAILIAGLSLMDLLQRER